MKEIQDLIRGLLLTLTDITTNIEDADSFEGKSDLLVAVDTAYNEISYALSSLS